MSAARRPTLSDIAPITGEEKNAHKENTEKRDVIKSGDWLNRPTKKGIIGTMIPIPMASMNTVVKIRSFVLVIWLYNTVFDRKKYLS